MPSWGSTWRPLGPTWHHVGRQNWSMFSQVKRMKSGFGKRSSFGGPKRNYSPKAARDQSLFGYAFALQIRATLSIYLSIYLSISLFPYLSIYLSMYLCIYLSIYLSIYVCMYVCVCFIRSWVISVGFRSVLGRALEVKTTTQTRTNTKH